MVNYDVRRRVLNYGRVSENDLDRRLVWKICIIAIFVVFKLQVLPEIDLYKKVLNGICYFEADYKQTNGLASFEKIERNF